MGNSHRHDENASVSTLLSSLLATDVRQGARALSRKSRINSSVTAVHTNKQDEHILITRDASSTQTMLFLVMCISAHKKQTYVENQDILELKCQTF